MSCRILATFVLLSPAIVMAADPVLEPVSASAFEENVRPVLVRYCGDCHHEGDSVHFLDATTVDGIDRQRGLWKSVAEQLHNRTMPPGDQPQPSEEERLEISRWIEMTLRATACRHGEFAPPVLPRRLNRVEYDNTIRDLLGVEFHASETFPVDGSGGEGFTTNGETLYLPPILMERYLEAAEEILDKALISPPIQIDVALSELLPVDDSKSSRTIDPGKQLTAIVTVYRRAEYDLTLSFDVEGATTFAVHVDGILAHRAPVETDKGETGQLQTTLRLARGTHAIAIRNEGEAAGAFHKVRLVQRTGSPSADAVRNHERLLGVEPGVSPPQPRQTAANVIRSFARRAFRRPVGDEEVERLLTLYDRAAGRGDPFEEAIRLPMKAVLVSPHFLFRIEGDPQGPELEPLNDHELAVRLSYFLWSSMPDAELFALAESGKLQDPVHLPQQVDRMLDDPKAHAFSEQFVGQWLGTKEVGALVAPDTGVFRAQFTSELLEELREEPIHLFDHLLREDGSLLELLSADYVIVNDRLAKHYGLIPGGELPEDQEKPRPPAWMRGKGGEFRRIDLETADRGGVLGMGAVHLLTSYPTRTSPVLRGAWVLETFLGVRVPPPPPDVPELKVSRKSKQTVREQLAEHRRNPACAACHNLMDPIGFSLEHYDVLGRWRDQEFGQPVDASASFPSGETFEGLPGLRQVLLARSDDYARHVTAKMLGYALGRSLADGDDCTIERIAETLIADDYRVRRLVHEIVLSPPFRNKSLVAVE